MKPTEFQPVQARWSVSDSVGAEASLQQRVYLHSMGEAWDLAAVARLIGEPARAVMLSRLLDGTAVPAGELAREAGISPQTASGHLSQLLDGGIVAVRTTGRHRYYRLSGPEVASALETLSVLPAPAPHRSRVPEALRFARTCYNHLAGRLGVAITAAFVEWRYVFEASDGFVMTDDGRQYLKDLGIEVDAPHRSLFTGRACVDWSERRPHFGGVLGHLLLDRMTALKWLAMTNVPRALRLTVEGRRELERTLRLHLDGF